MAVSDVPRTIPSGRILLGYEDFWSVPEDGNRYEVMEGELYVTPAPGLRHQFVSNRLQYRLEAHLQAERTGYVFAAPTAVILGERRQVQPDMLFVSTNRRKIIATKEIQGAPDLCVEIVSPSPARADRVTKASVYADSGVLWYWIVDPEEKTLEEYELDSRAYSLVRLWNAVEGFEPSLFPGLSFPLAELFDWKELRGLE